MLLMTRTTSDC